MIMSGKRARARNKLKVEKKMPSSNDKNQKDVKETKSKDKKAGC